MRQFVPRRSRAVGALVAFAALALALQPLGAEPKKKPKRKAVPIKIEETVGDIAFVLSGGEIDVEGVGLVVGLDNTGADAPPSNYRKELVDQMGKAGVEHPERLLASPRVSMVVVRMTIPLGAGPEDPLDVQVEVPPACATKSLAGGHLLTSRLYRMAIGRKGEILKDHELGWAQGPIMIGSPARPNDPKIGRVLGGGHPKKDYPYTLVIKENRESFHTSSLIERVVNTRFQETVDGHQKGAATAKTPSYLVLRVPPKYHQNQERYFRTVQLLPMIDTPELRVRRLDQWGKELLDPKTAGVAALKLEGLGAASVAALQAGLKSDNSQVQFFSAEALAYLDDTSGVEVLGEIITGHPEFRAYGLAALASVDQAASHMKLRKLMDEPDVEVRYGAFNALRTLDPHDPFLGHVRVLDAPQADEGEDNGPTESMALAIAHASSRRPRLEDPFSLYVVDSEGPPMVHVSRSRRAEIVLFGRRQKLLPPIVLGTGAFLLNASDNDDKIELSKIVPSRSGNSDSKMTTSLEINSVVRELANLGGSYPEIVTILEGANRQKNLPGPLMIDALPASNMVYLDAIMGRDLSAKRDPAVGRASRESSHRPLWRRLFKMFDRETTTNPSATETVATAGPSVPETTTAKRAGGPEKPISPSASAHGPADAVASEDGGVPKGGPPAERSAPKLDAGVQKTSTEADEDRPAPRRRRFLDFLRRDADD